MLVVNCIRNLNVRPFRRLYASGSGGHHPQSFHIENERPEDAMPFNYDRRAPFALKFVAFIGTAFSFPFFVVWWHSNKS
jgi:hypothetical protein